MDLAGRCVVGGGGGHVEGACGEAVAGVGRLRELCFY